MEETLYSAFTPVTKNIPDSGWEDFTERACMRERKSINCACVRLTGCVRVCVFNCVCACIRMCLCVCACLCNCTCLCVKESELSYFMVKASGGRWGVWSHCKCCRYVINSKADECKMVVSWCTVCIDVNTFWPFSCQGKHWNFTLYWRNW